MKGLRGTIYIYINMIISNYVEMTLGVKNCKKMINRYNLSESLKPGDVVKIPLEILSKSSHYEIEITCDYCDKKLKVPYKRYNLYTSVIGKYACSSKECSNQKIKDVCQKKYGVDNPFQYEEVKEKIKESLIEKYGVEHPMYMEETKNKIKETCLDRYGVTSYTKTEDYKKKTIETNLEKYGTVHESKTKEGQKKRKKTRIEKGNQIPDELLEPYTIYRKLVDNNLDIIRNKFLEDWDGFDYYDGEYIKNNLSIDCKSRLYPTIDHKVSVYYGFINNISVEEISDKKNLCVTKSYINSKKRELNENEFLEKYEIKKRI